MDPGELVRHLLPAYRRGLLVPFIGSGMSWPACRTWGGFLLGLADHAGLAVGADLRARVDQGTVRSTELYRLADAATRRLKLRGGDALTAACKRALYVKPKVAVPAQTHALAQIYWPLVLTTNYDDLLLRANAERSETTAWPRGELYGQSVDDCQAVLRSLDITMPPALWALQGYLGRADLTRTPLTPEKERRLAGEVVVGHQQYQNVINAKPHLRRAFAEVFRRRSLFFLGSGVQEDYLLNLYGEIIHHHGPSAHRHFAVFHEDKRRDVDERFFRMRLGIEPVFVPSYDDLPRLLGQLHENLAWDGRRRAAVVSSATTCELAYRFVRPDGAPGLVLRLQNDRLRVPAAGACVGVSVGVNAGGGPALGEMGNDMLALAGVTGKDRTRFARIGDTVCYRHEAAPWLYAINARSATGSGRRDLLAIPAALEAFLACAERDFTAASVGLLSAGPGRPWPAMYALTMMLRAVRRHALDEARAPALRELTISIVDVAVWAEIANGHMRVEPLLATGSTAVHVTMLAGDDEQELYSVESDDVLTIAQIAARCDLPPGRWRTSVYPMPTRRSPITATSDVVPGAMVTFAAARPDDVDDLIDL